MPEHVIGLRVAKFERRYNRAGDKFTDWVELYNLSGMDETGTIRSSTWHRIADLRPSEEYLTRETVSDDRAAALLARWADLEPRYTAWLNDQDAPETGMPLAAWAGMTASEAEAIRRAGYKTVEEVAAMPDQTADRVPLPNVYSIRAAARAYLEARPAAEQAARIAELEERIAAMQRELTAPAEPADDLDGMAEEQDRPRRGRPRKVEAA